MNPSMRNALPLITVVDGSRVIKVVDGILFQEVVTEAELYVGTQKNLEFHVFTEDGGEESPAVIFVLRATIDYELLKDFVIALRRHLLRNLAEGDQPEGVHEQDFLIESGGAIRVIDGILYQHEVTEMVWTPLPQGALSVQAFARGEGEDPVGSFILPSYIGMDLLRDFTVAMRRHLPGIRSRNNETPAA